MNENDIHKLLENAIIYENVLVEKKDFFSAREEFVYSLARSVSLLWQKCKDNNYRIDFECALRNYLITVKKSIVINNYLPSERFNDFGLQYNSLDGTIKTSILFPDFSNKELLKQIYLQEIEENKIDKNHNLSTNLYVDNLTGFKKFKSNEQKVAVMGALKVPYGYSCLVSMTTGGGKSLITQTVAYQEKGLTVVIVPTVSLMMDQYKNAKEIIRSNVDEEIFYHNSKTSLDSFYECLEKKTARILFISPESLIKNVKLREKIEQANSEGYVKNLVIDEAHIIVEWGSAFRIDFQCLDAIRKNFMRNNKKIRTYLLSATYSDETIRQLKLFYTEESNWIEIRCEKLRHETRFDIIKCNNYIEKRNKVMEAIDLLPRPMIVYVKSPDEAEKLKELLNGRGYQNIYTFTGNTDNDSRLNLIEEWKNGDFDLMIATCAFGVGVDKKNVRTVLHTYVPENPNKYYQEAGRGGRDGLPCLSSMIYTNQDVEAAFNFVSKVITTEKLIGRWFSMLNSNKTKPLLNSQYLIDTYVKPTYNMDEEFIDSISNQDINWNVNVILFLRRNGLLTIDDIQYINNKYVFYITINEHNILMNNEETTMFIDEIRNNEWKRTEKEFELIKKNLNKVGKFCWSDMFTKIYRLTNEYCAGCNQHTDITDFEDTKTLKKNVEMPVFYKNENLDSCMFDANCMLIVNKDYLCTLCSYIKEGINVLVSSNDTIDLVKSLKIEGNESLFYCNYNDFFELVSSNKFYISGYIAICIPDNTNIQNKIISIIEKEINYTEMKFLLFSDNDFEVTSKKKKISELAVIQHYKQE